MAYTYKSPDRDQLVLLPPSIREWLPEDHLAWLILDLVSIMDLSAFHARHPNNGVGRRAYDPEMMLALLLYGYCTGLRSSRKIADACLTDLGFKVICVDVVPAHDAVGRFRADHETAIGDLFVAVLMVCHRTGIVSLGTVALDGTKIAADAALDQNRTEDHIRAEVDRILAEAATADGDEHDRSEPQHWSGPGSRLARLRAALGEIDEQRAAAEAAEAAHLAALVEEGRRPRGRRPADPAKAVALAEADVAVCRQRVETAVGPLTKLKAVTELEGAASRLETARAALPAEPQPVPEHQANTTDPHSRIMKTQRGWVQGYNAQAAVTGDQIIVAATVTQDHNDVAQYQPVLDELTRAATAAGITEAVGTVLADAGYWSEPNATAPGPDRLIATTKDYKQRRAAREMGTTTGPPPPHLSALEQMEHRLRTTEGADLHARRSCLIEPVFGNIKTNRSITGFMRRGLDAARSEWAFICTTNNILKLHAHLNATLTVGI